MSALRQNIVEAVTHRQRGADMDFYKVVRADQLASKRPLLLDEGRDERGQDHQAGVHHELGHLRDAADVLHPVGGLKAQIPVQTLTHVVAVEDEVP